MKTTGFTLTILMIILLSCQNKNQEAMSQANNQNLIVLVKYKTLPFKSEEAITGLTNLIETVRDEPSFVNITLNVDPKDDTNILLYEEWSDETYYNGDHMKTNHIQSFIENSRAYLAGPPEISQWRVEKKFNLS